MTVMGRRPFGASLSLDNLDNDVASLAAAVDKLGVGRDLRVEFIEITKATAGIKHTMSLRVVDSNGKQVRDRFFILCLVSSAENDLTRPTGTIPVVTAMGNPISRRRLLDTEATTETTITPILLTDSEGRFGINLTVASIATRTGAIWCNFAVLGPVRSFKLFSSTE